MQNRFIIVVNNVKELRENYDRHFELRHFHEGQHIVSDSAHFNYILKTRAHACLVNSV